MSHKKSIYVQNMKTPVKIRLGRQCVLRKETELTPHGRHNV